MVNLPFPSEYGMIVSEFRVWRKKDVNSARIQGNALYGRRGTEKEDRILVRGGCKGIVVFDDLIRESL